MELTDALRTTGAVREFTDQAVDDAVLARVLDTARFAPSGSNAQAWRVVVVKDAANRRRLRDCYLQGSRDYLALAAAGLRPWSPTNDRDAEARALAAEKPAAPGGFAEKFDEAPVLLALFADLSMLAAIDRDADRYTFAAGASIYPFAWNVCWRRATEGLGGVITTIAIREEEAGESHSGSGRPVGAGRRDRAGLSGSTASPTSPRACELLCYGRFDRRPGVRGLDRAGTWHE